MKFGMGQRATRVEDARFLNGHGRYTDDHNLPHQLYAYILRSPFAHAGILSIDIAAAEEMPGVQLILTGQDVAGEDFGNLPCIAGNLVPLVRPDGKPMFEPPRPLLAKDRVFFTGDYVALVIADTLAQARDAAESIDVEYDEFAALTATEKATDATSPKLWPDCERNISFTISQGDKTKVKGAIAAADHVTTIKIPVSRIVQNPMEPRAALGDYDPGRDAYTLICGVQNPHDIRQLMADEVFHIPASNLRVVSPDMGGAFGMRSNIFPEMALVLWAAKKVGRPVKWTSDRGEGFLSDDQGRDMVLEVTLALSKDGEFQALHLNNIANMGAYLSIFGPFPAFGNMGGLAGVYRTPAISADITGVITNTTPVGPYRGAGRPEAIMAIECAIDHAATELGIDRVEIRRRNMIANDQMPYQTGHSYLYDCGRFEQNLDDVIVRADVEGFTNRRQISASNGRLRGLGIVNAIEQSAGLFDEGAEIRFDANGHATLLMGTHSHGQGHETVFRQIVADRLGLDFERIHFVQGDTDAVSHGHGTFGSRSLGLGGSAIHKTAEAIIEKGITIAAHVLETAEQDIEFSAGRFSVSGTDKALSLDDVSRIALNPSARPMDMQAGLRAFTTFSPVGPTFPNASHVCEVEIDPDTGQVVIDRYAVVCDVGTVINPLLLEGQVHGGVVQGLGQILLEEMVWDRDTGQPVTGSFMDYAMPRADNIPSIDVATNDVPTSKNPLGAKGAGESGTVGAMPCLYNAIADALAIEGATMVSMPASPEKIWRSIAEAR